MLLKNRTHAGNEGSIVQRTPLLRTYAEDQHEHHSNPAPALPRANSLHPSALTPADVLTLQRTVGNRAVQRLLHNQPGSVSSLPSTSAQTIQRQTEEEKLLPKSRARSNTTGLSGRLKTGVESLSGLAMDDVKVHSNSPKPAQVHARAYTEGTDIHLGPDEEEHLPHEALHVAQQKQGRVKPTLQMKGLPINDKAGLERKADVIGRSLQAKTNPSKPAHSNVVEQVDDPKQPRQLVTSDNVPIIQRKFLLGKDEYSGQHRFPDVKKLLEGAKLWKDEFGKILNTLLSVKVDHGKVEDVAELAKLLGKMADETSAAKEEKKVVVTSTDIGKEREKKAAKIIGGTVAATGKYGQDEVVYLDPDPKRKNHRHIKLDVKSDTVYGIVGGAAKGLTQSKLQQFEEICRDLRDISNAHKKTPNVFCDANTPETVIAAATKNLGLEYIINLQTEKPWAEEVKAKAKTDTKTDPTILVPTGGGGD